MRKLSKTKPTKVLEISIDAAKYFKNSAVISEQLRKAAIQNVKATKRHFKVDGWDLDYNFLVTEIFYTAFGHHLENYLWKELLRQKVAVSLTTKEGHTVLRLNSKMKKVKKAQKK